MSFEKMMEQLKSEYVRNLPQKIEEIRGSLQANRVDSIREDFHKLKGTGKTYGIPEISELGELVESLCDTHPQSLPDIVPEAVALLEEIHNQRQQSMEFPLQADIRFVRLRQLANQ